MDENNYTVVGINGFRRGGLTRVEADRVASNMRDQMRAAGWRGKVRIYYRDGKEVASYDPYNE